MKYIIPFVSLFLSSVAVAKEQSDCSAYYAHAGNPSEFVGEYRGECKNGLAHGKGELTIYDIFEAPRKLKATLKGNFHNSLFLGDIKYTGDILVDGDSSATKLGSIDGNEVWMHMQIEERGPVRFCQPIRIHIGVDNTAKLTNHEQTAAYFRKIISMHSPYCDGQDWDIPVRILDKQDVMNPHITASQVSATLNYAKTDPLTNYRNMVADTAERVAAEEKILNDLRDKTRPVFKEYGLKEIVDMEMLDENLEDLIGQHIAIPAALSYTEEWEEDVIAVITDASRGFYLNSAIVYVPNLDTLPKSSFLLIGEVKGALDNHNGKFSEIKYKKHIECVHSTCGRFYQPEFTKDMQ